MLRKRQGGAARNGRFVHAAQERILRAPPAAECLSAVPEGLPAPERRQGPLFAVNNGRRSIARARRMTGGMDQFPAPSAKTDQNTQP